MNALVLVAAIGAAEGVSHMLRIRGAASDSWRYSAATTAVVCALRWGFLAAGIGIVEGGSTLSGGLAYIAAASVATALVHGRLTRERL